MAFCLPEPFKRLGVPITTKKSCVMEIKIAQPCNENWDNMKISLTSRHCQRCEKQVMDFTQMTKEEIIYYLLSNPNANVCGRMQRQQVDFHHEDVPALMNALSKKGGNTSFLILALVCLSLAACKADNRSDATTRKTPTEKTPEPTRMTVGIMSANPKNGIPEKTIPFIVSPPPVVHPPVVHSPVVMAIDSFPHHPEIMGDIAILPPDVDIIAPPAPQDPVLSFVEVMPEYVGGITAMQAFIHKEMSYPTSEKEAGIEGVVYVQFVVHENGTLSDFTVLRGIQGGKGLDREALRVVSKMPNWIPGRNNGQNVKAYFRMPIRFKLD